MHKMKMAQHKFIFVILSICVFPSFGKYIFMEFSGRDLLTDYYNAGKPDLFLKVYEGNQCVIRTPARHNDQNPDFNCYLRVDDQNQNKRLRLEVFDAEYLNPDVYLGPVYVNTNVIDQVGNYCLPLWYEDIYKGKICLHTTSMTFDVDDNSVFPHTTCCLDCNNICNG